MTDPQGTAFPGCADVPEPAQQAKKKLVGLAGAAK